MCSQGVGDVKQDAAHSAHGLLVVSRSSHAGRAVHRCRVDPARGRALPLEPDVSVLSPARSPAVPDDPVVSLLLVGA